MFFFDICQISKLETSDEEEDTNITLHAMHLRESHNVNATILSSSDDTDIIVLLLAFLKEHKDHILIIDMHG